MTLVSRNIIRCRPTRIFAEVPLGGGINNSGVVDDGIFCGFGRLEIKQQYHGDVLSLVGL